MNASTKDFIGTPPALTIWTDLRAYLERLGKDLSEEVHSYPTPIARCDVQLTKLIEQRRLAMDLLRRIAEVDQADLPSLSPPLLAAMEAFLLAPEFDRGDQAETVLRARLKAALAKISEQT
ncbi:MAG: hypothetical protein V4634_00330 [Pseudomonadota bacterium]